MYRVKIIVAAKDESAAMSILGVADFEYDDIDLIHSEPLLLCKLRDVLSANPQSPDDPVILIAAGSIDGIGKPAWNRMLTEFPGLRIVDWRQQLTQETRATLGNGGSLDSADSSAGTLYEQCISIAPVVPSAEGWLRLLQKTTRNERSVAGADPEVAQ